MNTDDLKQLRDSVTRNQELHQLLLTIEKLDFAIEDDKRSSHDRKIVRLKSPITRKINERYPEAKVYLDILLGETLTKESSHILASLRDALVADIQEMKTQIGKLLAEEDAFLQECRELSQNT